MTGQYIRKKKTINKKNSTWDVLKLIRKQDITFFSFATREKPRKFERVKTS